MWIWFQFACKIDAPLLFRSRLFSSEGLIRGSYSGRIWIMLGPVSRKTMCRGLKVRFSDQKHDGLKYGAGVSLSCRRHSALLMHKVAMSF